MGLYARFYQTICNLSVSIGICWRHLGLSYFKNIRSRYVNTGCGEKIFTLLLYILFRVVCMSLRRVIWRSNGNFVGFPRIILKIVKNYPMKHNSHLSGEWQIWPTRNWNLTLNFEAIWGQYGLKCLTLVYSHSNIILEWIFLATDW